MSAHPTPQLLDDYLSGRLDDDQCDAVEKHLDACPQCAASCSQQRSMDTLTELLIDAHQLGSVQKNSSRGETDSVGLRTTSLPEASLTGATLPTAPTGSAELVVFREVGTQDGSNDSLLTASLTDSHLQAMVDDAGSLKDHSRYEILRPLGRGGMGVVWLARHKTMDRLVAIKIIRRSQTQNETMVSWFRQEARIISMLNHRNIVSAYDAEDSESHLFIVFEYIDGETLAEIAQREPLNEIEALALIRDVANGLACAHAHGLVHRDIKPGNLIRDRQGTIKILDFGIASKLESDTITREANGPVGTRYFLAPECYRMSPPSSASDIYALGCTLYHLLTGHPPKQPPTAEVPAVLADADTNPRLSATSPATRQLLGKMAAYAADNRLPSAEAVIAEVNEILNSLTANKGPLPVDQSTKSAPLSPNDTVGPASRFWSRRRVLLTACSGMAAGSLSLAALPSIQQWFTGKAVDAPPGPALRNTVELTPEMAQQLSRFGPGTDHWLLMPTVLGDGQSDDFVCSDKELFLRVFESGRQAWLNYESVTAHRVGVAVRVQMLRHQNAFSSFKIAFLNHQGFECNFQWVCHENEKRMCVEAISHGRLARLWDVRVPDESDLDSAFFLYMAGSSLEIYSGEQLITKQVIDETAERFPALATRACDADVSALARVYAS